MGRRKCEAYGLVVRADPSNHNCTFFPSYGTTQSGAWFFFSIFWCLEESLHPPSCLKESLTVFQPICALQRLQCRADHPEKNVDIYILGFKTLIICPLVTAVCKSLVITLHDLLHVLSYFPLLRKVKKTLIMVYTVLGNNSGAADQITYQVKISTHPLKATVLK